MKKIKFILAGLLVAFALNVLSQVPPDPPGGHGSSGDAGAGGGAPIGSGLLILLGLAAAYGGTKLYQIKKEDLEE
ncbi:MAG: hypothetical protein H8E34_05335 [Bacteroidetes bacterium]|nr:hypothetical protein [Bacteroidota bacterium]